MPNFLIVNDDGADSPMLRPMVQALGALGDVTLAVPSQEQSWRGKAMTRYGHIQVAERQEFGVPAFAVDGTPSDCVNLAVHHLFPRRPDWVISGINIGSNTGLAFALNSGTIGGAVEGALQGLPALAFSTLLSPEMFTHWVRERHIPGGEDILSSNTARMAAMVEALLGTGMPRGAQVLNVNFPGAVTPDTPVQWAPLQDNRYGSLFRRKGEGFVHGHGDGLRVLPGPLSDRDVVAAGGISVTALSLAGWSLPAPAESPF